MTVHNKVFHIHGTTLLQESYYCVNFFLAFFSPYNGSNEKVTRFVEDSLRGYEKNLTEDAFNGKSKSP